MRLLSIDTTSNVCSVAILDNDTLICELNSTDMKTHSEKLMPLIDEALSKAKLKLADIEAIACGIGPGSFTGIRIGIATVKAIAEVFELPVIGITSLETLAFATTGKTICSLIDAKNNQVYCGIFNEEHTLLEDYIADDIHIAIKALKKYSNITFVGNGADLHEELLRKEFPDCNIVPNVVQSAFHLGRCAITKKDAKNADTILPLYLRKSQAERMRQENGN